MPFIFITGRRGNHVGCIKRYDLAAANDLFENFGGRRKMQRLRPVHKNMSHSAVDAEFR